MAKRRAPSNVKPESMRTSPLFKTVATGGVMIIDQTLNEDDMYIFELNGRRLSVYRYKSLIKLWEDKGKPDWSVHVVLSCKNGNSRLVTKY